MSKWEIETAERIQLPLRTDQDALTQMFYLRRNALKAKIAIQGQDNFYAINTHATAFATDDTKQRHIDKFSEVLDEIDEAGYVFVAGGDLNSVPPGAEIDFCVEDACEDDILHTAEDGGPHLEGSYFNNFEDEPVLLQPLYNTYNTAISLADAVTSTHNTHSTSWDRELDRKLDYIFTNQEIVSETGQTHQDAVESRQLSDHAPVSVSIILGQ